MIYYNLSLVHYGLATLVGYFKYIPLWPLAVAVMVNLQTGGGGGWGLNEVPKSPRPLCIYSVPRLPVFLEMKTKEQQRGKGKVCDLAGVLIHGAFYNTGISLQ